MTIADTDVRRPFFFDNLEGPRSEPVGGRRECNCFLLNTIHMDKSTKTSTFSKTAVTIVYNICTKGDMIFRSKRHLRKTYLSSSSSLFSSSSSSPSISMPSSSSSSLSSSSFCSKPCQGSSTATFRGSIVP